MAMTPTTLSALKTLYSQKYLILALRRFILASNSGVKGN